MFNDIIKVIYMSMQDPIADMLTCIRNAQNAKLCKVIIPFSNIKFTLAQVMYREGYIKNINKIDDKRLEIHLKYFRGNPVIEEITRISKPSLRIYRKHKDLPNIMGGLGIAIVSTSRGIMSNKEAKKQNIGGEIICHII